MIEHLPNYISVVFALTTFITIAFFYWVMKSSSLISTQKKSMYIGCGLVLWTFLQALLTFKQVYSNDTHSLPPKIMLLGVFPMFLSILILFVTNQGRQFMDSLPLSKLTYLHIIRIPVELVLWWLFLNKAVPELMTFEGRNFDILSGISAPIIAYLSFAKGKLNRTLLLSWNIISLVLLLNIVMNAILSSPFPFQQFAFDQSNIAILYFPFSWLPTVVVPIVLFVHLVSIRQLMIGRTDDQ